MAYMISEPSKSDTTTFARYLTLFLSAVSFFVPFLLSQSQIPTGIFVNAVLYLAVWYLPPSQRLPMIVLPSLASVMRGAIFGGLTPYLLIMMPFIWLGNYCLTVLFDVLQEKVGIYMSGIIAACGKCAVLFGVATLLVHQKTLPQLFLKTMGMLQLLTAIGGFIVALLLHQFISSRRRV